MNIQFSNVSCTLDHRNIIEDLTLSFEERGIYTFIEKSLATIDSLHTSSYSIHALSTNGSINISV